MLWVEGFSVWGFMVSAGWSLVYGGGVHVASRKSQIE